MNTPLLVVLALSLAANLALLVALRRYARLLGRAIGNTDRALVLLADRGAP